MEDNLYIRIPEIKMEAATVRSKTYLYEKDLIAWIRKCAIETTDENASKAFAMLADEIEKLRK